MFGKHQLRHETKHATGLPTQEGQTAIDTSRGIGGHNVDEAVEVEVACCQPGWFRSYSGEIEQERAARLGAQQRNGVIEGIRSGNVEAGVSIEIMHNHGFRRGIHHVGRCLRKPALPIVAKNADRIVPLVGNDQLRPSVTGEIRRRNSGGRVANGICHARVDEGAVAQAQQHTDIASIVIGDGKVLLAVPIEIRNSHGNRRKPDRILIVFRGKNDWHGRTRTGNKQSDQ